MGSENCSWSYDVFVSFRGEDTRNSFTSHLYAALVQAGISTFIDTEELKRGVEISQELCEAIDGSRFFLVVFSKNYASSSWCLDELVRIVSCMDQNCKDQQMVWPVFYDVDPSEVRMQKHIFGEAFMVHEERFKDDSDQKVQKWRKALTKAANLSGWHLDKRSESSLVKEIVGEILSKLNRTVLLSVAKNPVGMDFHIEKLEWTLGIESNDVRMIGIYGLGGIGKTTLAKAVYNLIANHFEGCSFLPVKERCKFNTEDELTKLQESLLKDILLVKMGGSSCINLSDAGTNILKDRLSKKKILVVLDDVDNSNQLEKLVGNVSWLGPGSRVIITTRDEQLLKKHKGIKWTYRVDKLNHGDALELFCWNAFNNPLPDVDFEELSNAVVKYADGLPLALIVVGASLCSCTKREWESQLQKLKKIPNKDVHNKLELSFDGLGELEKAMFLDIACFFRWYRKQDVDSFFDACDFYPDFGIQVLIRKCLVYIEYGEYQMHDLIQLMGREIVRRESPYPEERSRLWYHEDILQVLNENEGTKKVEGIFLDMSNVEVFLHAEAFSKMKKLRLLIIRNVKVIGTPQLYISNELRWLECPNSSSSIVPSTFHPKKLVVLKISHYPIKQLGTKLQGFENLRRLKLVDCEMLTEIGDISSMSNLVQLVIMNCVNLECFSKDGLKLKCLEDLTLGFCPKLKKFPNILEEMRRLQRLYLEGCGVTELPTCIEKLTNLWVLNLSWCKDLVHLPSSIYMLKKLECFTLNGCKRLEKFPQLWNSKIAEGNSTIQDLGSTNCLDNIDFVTAFNYYFDSLEYLDMSESKIRRLPSGMSKFKRLYEIRLLDCKYLQHIPADLPPLIWILDARGCHLLPKIDVTNFFDIDTLSNYANYLCQDWKQLCFYQAISNDREVQLFLPQNEIPNSFEYCSTCGPLMLQLPLHVKKHSIVGIMLFCQLVDSMKSSKLEVQINGLNIMPKYTFFKYKNYLLDGVWISYLPRNISSNLNKVLEDDPSHFDITFLLVEEDYYHVEQRKSLIAKFGIRWIF